MNNSFSPAHERYLHQLKSSRWLIITARILIAIIFISSWELLTRFEIIDAFIFSSPSRIVKCFMELASDGTIFRHIGITVGETILCFLIVIGLGLIVAMILWRFNTIFKISEPYLVLLNSLPKSALAPLLIVWLGNNIKTIIVAGAILSIYTAFMETEPEKIKLMHTLKSTRRQTLFKLVIPQSMPSIINTMKVNLGLSLVGVIIGEFLAAREGLGYMIIYATQTFKMDWVLLAIVILCLLSIGLYQLINIIKRRF